MTSPIPTACFAACDIDDAVPFVGWQPSPAQIAEWAAAIRSEWTPAETERRLRPDWRDARVECTTSAVVSDDCTLIE